MTLLAQNQLADVGNHLLNQHLHSQPPALSANKFDIFEIHVGSRDEEASSAQVLKIVVYFTLFLPPLIDECHTQLGGHSHPQKHHGALKMGQPGILTHNWLLSPKKTCSAQM